MKTEEEIRAWLKSCMIMYKNMTNHFWSASDYLPGQIQPREVTDMRLEIEILKEVLEIED